MDSVKNFVKKHRVRVLFFLIGVTIFFSGMVFAGATFNPSRPHDANIGAGLIMFWGTMLGLGGVFIGSMKSFLIFLLIFVAVFFILPSIIPLLLS